MASQESAHGRFAQAIRQRNLRGAEITARELGQLSLADALDYVLLVAEMRPEQLDVAAIRWQARLELEAVGLTLVDSQLALAALADLRAGAVSETIALLKRLLRRVRPTLSPGALRSRQRARWIS